MNNQNKSGLSDKEFKAAKQEADAMKRFLNLAVCNAVAYLRTKEMLER